LFTSDHHHALVVSLRCLLSSNHNQPSRSAAALTIHLMVPSLGDELLFIDISSYSFINSLILSIFARGLILNFCTVLIEVI
jgi:hypothetical protein